MTTPTKLSQLSSLERDKSNSLQEQSNEKVQNILDTKNSSSLYSLSIDEQKQQSELSDEESERISLTVDVDSKRGAARKQHWKSQSVGETQQLVEIDSLQMNPNSSHDEDFRELTTFSANRELWQRRAASQTQINPPVTPKSFRSSQEFREMRQKHTPDLVMDLPISAQDPSNKSASSNDLSGSDEETPMQPSRIEAATSPTGGPESPDMSTAAERFAKQNQCTLKKNTKASSESAKFKRIENAQMEDEVDSNEVIGSDNLNQISGTIPPSSPLTQRSTPKIAAKFADMHLTGGSQVSSFKPQVKMKPTILRKPVLPFAHPHMSPELARKIEKQAQNADQAN